jgi:hypothetical protein
VRSATYFVKEDDKETSRPKGEEEKADEDPIPETKVSEVPEDFNDPEYWLSLATEAVEDKDKEKEENAGDDISEISDDAFLELFHKRWGTPQQQKDDTRSRSRSTSPALTAPSSEEGQPHVEKASTIEEQSGESKDGRDHNNNDSAQNEPPSSPSGIKRSKKGSPNTKNVPLAVAAEAEADNAATASAPVIEDVDDKQEPTVPVQGEEGGKEAPIEDKPDSKKTEEDVRGDKSEKTPVRGAASPFLTKRPKSESKKKEKEAKEEEEKDELLAVIDAVDAERGAFETMVHDLVGGGVSGYDISSVDSTHMLNLCCWRCRSKVDDAANLFCVHCGAKVRKKGWNQSVIATPSSSITGVTIGNGDGGASISTYAADTISLDSIGGGTDGGDGDGYSSAGTSPSGKPPGSTRNPDRDSPTQTKRKKPPPPGPLPAYMASGIKHKLSQSKKGKKKGEEDEDEPGNHSNQTELELLPPKVLEALNLLRVHITDPKVLQQREEALNRKEQAVLAMEIEHSLRLEDLYMNVSTLGHMGHNPDKVRSNPGITFAEPSGAIKELMSKSSVADSYSVASSVISSIDFPLGSAGISQIPSAASSVAGTVGTGTGVDALHHGGTYGLASGAGALALGEGGMSMSLAEGSMMSFLDGGPSLAGSQGSLSNDAYPSVFEEIDTTGSIHSQTNMVDPLGNYAHLVNPRGKAQAAAGGGSVGGSASISSCVTGTGSGSIYSHENRPVGLAKIQAEYSKIDRTLPRVAYASTDSVHSIPMPSYVRQPKQKVVWRKDKLETLALQKSFQVVHTKGVTREKELKVDLKPTGTVVVEQEWKPTLPTDRPYLGDRQSDKLASRTKFPMKTYSYVTSYLDDEVPSIMTYFDQWFARERELTLPGAAYNGTKFVALEGSTGTTENYHYLQYLKSMKKTDRRRRKEAEMNVTRLYDQAVEREKRSESKAQEQKQKQERAEKMKKAQAEQLMPDAVMTQQQQEQGVDEVTASGSFFWGGAPSLPEEDEEELLRHLQQEEEDEEKDEGPVKQVDKDYTEGGAKAFWWGPLKAKGRFLLPHNYHLEQQQQQQQRADGGNDGSSVGGLEEPSDADEDLGDQSSIYSRSNSRKAARQSKKKQQEMEREYMNSAGVTYANITGDEGAMPPHPSSPGWVPPKGGDVWDKMSASTTTNGDWDDDASIATAESIASRIKDPYQTFGSSGRGYGAPQLLNINNKPGYMQDTATTQAKTYFSRPGTSTKNDTVGDLTIRGGTPALHPGDTLGAEETARIRQQKRQEAEIMFQAFADTDTSTSSKHFLPKDDPHGFSERYGNIDKYYGGTMSDDSLSEGEEEREERERKERKEIDQEMNRLREKEEKRQEKIALMRRHGLLGSDSEPSSDEDDSESEVEVETPPISPRLLDPQPRSIMHKERLEEMVKPMLWTGVIQPDGPSGFDDDVAKGLERPLTPEPTSDDEDAAFEAELIAMQEKEKNDKKKKEQERGGGASSGDGGGGGDAGKAAEEEERQTEESTTVSVAVPSVFSWASEEQGDTLLALTEGGEPRLNSATSTASSNPAAEAAIREVEAKAKEEEESEDIVPDKVIAQRKADRKKYLASMRKKLKFDAIFDVSGPNREQLEPICRQNPDAELRHKENWDVKSLMPGERGHAVMSRLYKRSTLLLKEVVVAPNQIDLTCDPIYGARGLGADTPWRVAHEKMSLYQGMIEAIDEALIKAPINDATARKEFIAYRNTLAKRRTTAAHKVSSALQRAAECQRRYDTKHDELVQRITDAPEPKRPKIRDFIAKIKENYTTEMLALGDVVVSAQQEEEKEVSSCQQLEETCVRVLAHWRPIHSELFEETKLVKFRLEGLIRIIAARVIQRTARRRLCMFYRGTPEELEDDMLKDMERRMAAKKKKVYKMRPW